MYATMFSYASSFASCAHKFRDDVALIRGFDLYLLSIYLYDDDYDDDDLVVDASGADSGGDDDDNASAASPAIVNFIVVVVAFASMVISLLPL